MSPLAIKRLGPSPAIQLDIGRNRLRLSDGKRVWRQPGVVPLKAGIPSEETLARFRREMDALCANVPNGQHRLEVTLSDVLVRYWLVERIPGLRNGKEIDLLAEHQMLDIYGDSPALASQWLIRVDATPFGKIWLAIALPKAFVDCLVELAVGKGWTLGAVRPRFVACMNARSANPFQKSGDEIFTLASSDGLTLAIRDKQQWRSLRTHPPLTLLGTDLPTLLRRDCRAAGLQVEDFRVEKLEMKGSGRQALRLDFSPVNQQPLLRAGLGTALLVAILFATWSLIGDTEAGPPPHPVSLPGLEEVQAINAAVDELNFPWGKVFGLIEAVIDDGQRVSVLEADARERRLNLQGEARNSRSVLDLPGRLRADLMVSDARVLSQGPAEASLAAGFPFRFAIEVAVRSDAGEQP